MTLHVGIDLGGTNLRAAAFDADLGKPHDIHKELVGDARDPASIVERVAIAAERFANSGGASGPATLGVGIAAMLRDRRGMVANSPHLHWRDVDFGGLLAKRLGSRWKLGIYNDVNAITWGESIAGAARGCRDVLAVYVGTGIGGGVISGGQLVEGATNCAGEIGHVKVRWDDTALPCACGGRGCVEAYVGGSYVVKRIAAELPTKGKKSLAISLAGGIEHVTPGHVDRAAEAGDDWALALWTELAPLLGVALGNAVSVLNPERLILGGGLLSRTPTLYALVEVAVTIAVPSASIEPLTIVPAELGDEAGLVGAANLAATGTSVFSA
ncbi:MAG: ROK family protein [Deltaproteobacteria bacterium]|nr:ROK family protein [Deltaproteobacteria bacterium]MDQ3300443.1 ROK family protein [Myxococcota bacterium]